MNGINGSKVQKKTKEESEISLMMGVMMIHTKSGECKERKNRRQG